MPVLGKFWAKFSPGFWATFLPDVRAELLPELGDKFGLPVPIVADADEALAPGVESAGDGDDGLDLEAGDARDRPGVVVVVLAVSFEGLLGSDEAGFLGFILGVALVAWPVGDSDTETHKKRRTTQKSRS